MACRLFIVAWLEGCLLAGSAAFAAEPVVTEGRVTAVTVYQGQALVTRELDLADAQGLLEVVVTNLPESVQPGSLYAEPTGNLEVRSVRYRARPVEEDVRKEVRELDQKIQDVQDQSTAIAEERSLLGQRKNYLTQLGQFTAFMSQQELKSGVLNSETLKDLTQFLFSERDTISNRELELAKLERAANEQRNLLTRERDTITAGSSRTVREAVVFINAPQAGAARLRLSYLVGNASWSPSYNVRATTARDQVTVEYNASVQQMSGEDWSDVQMVLSTATPSLVATAPKLEPLAIKLGQLQLPQSAAAEYSLARRNIALLGKMRGAEVAAQVAVDRSALPAAANASGMAGGEVAFDSARGAMSGRDGGSGGVGGWEFAAAQTAETDKNLNRTACELQLLDFNNSLKELRSDAGRATSATEGVSVSYRLANHTSLPSRSDRQVIQIASVPLSGEFYRLASPVLTSYVYEEARLTNSSDLVFLAGPVATFLGSEFVGRGDLPTISIGESFTVGLGIDSSLRAGRELVKKDEHIQGGNRVVDFVYELSLENFGNAPAKVRMLDRLPTSSQDDIKVSILSSDQPVSDDPGYQSSARKDGILRWDVEVPAQSLAPKQMKLRYTMQIEYDKQLAIVGMPDKA